MASSTAATIGLLLGSLRQGGNNAGIATWLTAFAQRELSTSSSGSTCSIQQIFPFPATSSSSSASPTRYPGPVLDPPMAQAVKHSADYPSPAIQQWSTVVRSCAGFILATPQYNWGVPGELKNAIDHLYWEWSGKPFLVVTYGGHGGSRCDEQLRVIMGGGLKMRTVEQKVEITLPRDFIAGERRVGDGGDDSFLEQYEEALTKAVTELAGMLQPAAGASTEAAVKA